MKILKVVWYGGTATPSFEAAQVLTSENEQLASGHVLTCKTFMKMYIISENVDD